MPTPTFIELVKKHFSSLIVDYEFTVVNEEYNLRVYGDRFVEFRSSNAIVVITWELDGRVEVDVGPAAEPRIARFPLTTIVYYFDPEVHEVFKLAISRLERPSRDNIEYQLAHLAPLVSQYCEPMLRGDFSQWLNIGKSIVNASKEYYKELTGTELDDGDLANYLKSKGVSL